MIRIKIMYLTCFHSIIFTHCKVYILYVYVLSIHLTCKCLQIQQYLKLPTSAYKKILTWSPFTVGKGEGGTEMLTYKGREKGSNLRGSYISRTRQPLHRRAFTYYVSREGGEGGLHWRLFKIFCLWQILRKWRGGGCCGCRGWRVSKITTQYENDA